MENTMGTLTDSKDGKARSDMTLSSVNDTAATEDRIPGTETPHGESPTTSNAGKYSYNITVKGSENSTVGENIATGVFNYTVNNNEKEQEGLACDVTEGEKPKLKISVPAEDGGTMIHVDCTKGKVRHWSYCRNVDIEKTFGSRWTFGNIFDGFMAAIINGKIGDDFFDLIGKWVELYGCKLHKVYKKCLVIEFLHETEEGRDRMIKDKETVKQMFQTFVKGINPNASSCTLEVSTEKETTPSSDKPDTELKHIEQDVSEDVSVPSTSKSEQAQAQGMMPREYKKEEQFQSVSDDESERPLSKKMKYSGESEELAEFRRIKEERPITVKGVAGGSIMKSIIVGTALGSIMNSAIVGGPDMSPEPIMYFGLQPIPVSQVHLYTCRRCDEVLQNCEKELSTLKDIFFIHFDPTLENVRLSELQLQFTKILSAFRNSQGGVLIVHQRNTPDSGDSLHKFLYQIFGSILTHDLVTCDVFKSQQIGTYKDMFRVDVQPSEMFITCDLKTKFPSLSIDKFENGSNEKIRHLLFSSRTTESTEPSLEGISAGKQNVEALRLRYTGPPWSYFDGQFQSMFRVLADSIMTTLSLPEHITSLSKKQSGGTMFVAMPSIPIFLGLLETSLMKTLKKNMRVQINKHSKVSLQDIDVFKIGLSIDADSEDFILEIAVGHVNGCVFYDPQGPESYKIEGEKIVRLPIERWVEEAFE